MTGHLTVVGLGPGRADWCTPAVARRLADASDVVGYGPYVAMLDVLFDGSVTARRHVSDNRVEADRARHALDLAAAGGDVVIVSSGDPGVFAMASAVLEQLDEHRDRWLDVRVDVETATNDAPFPD
ncbi:MAG: SAM-dependent methyltransferase, partial [Ilumatobacteraceae bacterium]